LLDSIEGVIPVVIAHEEGSRSCAETNVYVSGRVREGGREGKRWTYQWLFSLLCMGHNRIRNVLTAPASCSTTPRPTVNERQHHFFEDGGDRRKLSRISFSLRYSTSVVNDREDRLNCNIAVKWVALRIGGGTLTKKGDG
jgi:hypothetical protein